MATQSKSRPGLFFLIDPEKKERFRLAAISSGSTMTAELNEFIDDYLASKEITDQDDRK